MFKRFISYYKPHKKMLVLDLLASLFIAVIGMVYPVVTREMLENYIPNRMYATIVIAGVVVLTLYIIRMLLRYFVQYYGHLIGVKMQSQMRVDLFNHLQKLPFKFYDNNETGRIMTRITSDLFEVCELAHHGPENLLISSVMIILSFVYLFSIDPILTLIIFTCMPIMIIVSSHYRKSMEKAFDERRKSTATINASVESSITGIRVTKAFTNAEKEKEKFEEGNEQFVDARKDAYKAMGQFHSANSFITNVFNVVILIAGGLFLYNGRIDFADYSAFVVSVNLFVSPVSTLIGFMEQYQEGVTGFERFLEIIDTEPEKDSPNAVDIGVANGHIRFENVTFGYNDSETVLKNVTLDVPCGKTFALVGPSGGGKTTICHLIPHFYNITEGKVYIDDKEIHDITMDSLRRNIGIVQQDIYLFNSTIRENILYGRPDATEQEVIEAAKRANIHEYIMSLPDGYETEIGERGVRLSGGQKQRLSIARVFLKNPPILILDEATSALDNATEILIQQSLDELCKGRTTIVVAHRLSTIRGAHEIAVISGGEITEKGTHEELLSAGGTYASLYSAVSAR